MKQTGFVLLFIGCAVTASAQFNDTINYYLNYSATGIINRTQVANSYVFNNQFRGSARKNDVSLNSAVSWIYGQLDKQLSNNDLSATLDFDYRKDSSRVAYWALGNFDKSFSLKINKRIQYGAGISYDFIRKGDDRINISNGLLYESSDLQRNDTLHEVYQTWRNSLRLKYRFGIRDLVVLEGIHFLQNSLRHKTDYIIRSNTTLSVKIYKWVSFSGALTYNKLNRLSRENLLITLGIAFEKYF